MIHSEPFDQRSDCRTQHFTSTWTVADFVVIISRFKSDKLQEALTRSKQINKFVIIQGNVARGDPDVRV